MSLGTVKSFDARKGSGLITPDAGGGEIFVHISVVEQAGLSGLSPGERVSFDLRTDRVRARSYAVNLELA